MVDDPAETSQKIISTDGSKLLVLIAEDEPLIQATLEDVVAEAGFEHFSVSSADDAICTLEEDDLYFGRGFGSFLRPDNGRKDARRSRRVGFGAPGA